MFTKLPVAIKLIIQGVVLLAIVLGAVFGFKQFGMESIYFWAIIVMAVVIPNLFTFIILKGTASIAAVMSDKFDTVGKGNLKVSFQDDELNAHPEVLSKAKAFFDKFKATFNQFQQTAQSMTKELKDVTDWTQKMKTDSTDQTRTVSDTAAAVSELSASIAEIAQSSDHIKNSAIQTTQIAENGGKAVSSMMEGMNKITDRIQEVDAKLKALVESNKRISSIITVITEISEQTNLLALNAAIEAARAGEHGRGFAVVADEVRILAERSQKSASEVVDLIEQTNQQSEEAVRTMKEGEAEVQVGAELSNNAGKALKEIITHIKDVSIIISDVSSAVNEQVKVAENISSSMEQVNESTNNFQHTADSINVGTQKVVTESEALLQLINGYQFN